MYSNKNYTKWMIAENKKPLYSLRNVIKSGDDPRCEKLRKAIEDGKNIKVYSYYYEPLDVKTEKEIKEYCNVLVDIANFNADKHASSRTETLLYIVDPKNLGRRDDPAWPFYTMCNDIDWDKEWNNLIIVLKKEDPNF